MLSGRLEEAHTLTERAWHSPVNTSNVSTRRMPCASLARSRRGASPWRVRKPKRTTTSPRSGRGVGHAPPPGPLPPRPRHPVCADRPARAGPCALTAALALVPGYGHDLLATPDGGGAGAGGGGSKSLWPCLAEVCTFLQRKTGEPLCGAVAAARATESPAGHVPTCWIGYSNSLSIKRFHGYRLEMSMNAR